MTVPFSIETPRLLLRPFRDSERLGERLVRVAEARGHRVSVHAIEREAWAARSRT